MIRRVLLFLIFVFVIKTSSCSSEKVLSLAILNIIDEEFVKTKSDLNLISDKELAVLASAIASDKLIRTIPIRILDASETIRCLSQNSLHFFESIASFKKAFQSVDYLKIDSVETKHLFYIKNASTDDIENIKMINFDAFNLNFLIEVNDTTIQLLGFTAFDKSTCQRFSLEVINTFCRRHRKWKNKEFFPKKNRNFHGCKLNFFFSWEPPKNFWSDDNKPSGFNIDILNMLSVPLNFTVSYIDLNSQKSNQNLIELRILSMGMMPKVVSIYTVTSSEPPSKSRVQIERSVGLEVLLCKRTKKDIYVCGGTERWSLKTSEILCKWTNREVVAYF